MAHNETGLRLESRFAITDRRRKDQFGQPRDAILVQIRCAGENSDDRIVGLACDRANFRPMI